MAIYHTDDSQGAIWTGTSGRDYFYSSLYNDYMFAGAGDDEFIVNSIANANIYSGGDGYDVIHATGLGQYQSFQAISILSLTGVEEIKSSITYADTYIYLGTRLPVLSNNPTGGSDLDTHTLNLSNVKLTNIAGIRGSYNDDTIVASYSDDVLSGLGGDDFLTGGAGADTFSFETGFGHDTVTDFMSEDTIEFSVSLFADAASVLAAATQTGSDTVITYDADNSITLENVALSSLGVDDFAFV